MYSITKNGKPLDEALYTIDVENKVFSSLESDLVLDFTGQYEWAFKTGSGCNFLTGPGCTFKTDHNCVFDTGYRCTFKTSHDCTFKTGSRCTFKTYHGCVFTTGWDCTFKTYHGCVFTTGNGCTLLCHGNKTYRHFLDDSNYIFTEEQLIEIKDKNTAILNSKHENEQVRNLCKDILKG